MDVTIYSPDFTRARLTTSNDIVLDIGCVSVWTLTPAQAEELYNSLAPIVAAQRVLQEIV